MDKLTGLVKKYNDTSLILRIFIGLVIGAVLGVAVPKLTWIGLFGQVFVGCLKAIAPILVFVLIASALCQGSSKLDKRFGLVLWLYMISTFLAALVSTFASFIFKLKITFPEDVEVTETPPSGLGEVLQNLLLNVVKNPVESLATANYIGILFWAAFLGIAFKLLASEHTCQMLKDLADAVSQIVRWIINLAPFGIMGLVFSSVSTSGLSIFTEYGKLILLLVGCMFFVALVIDPILAAITLKRNPYPLVWRCLKHSGITAFFTRSSAANIPINMNLCKKLGLDPDMYSVSIPLGATINMDGAAVTITVMTLATANTMGVNVDLPTAIILSFIAALGACGASGVAGGSLLLIPMACALFGIPNDVAMMTVGVGYIIGVVQDSVETALNSSGDVMFAATAEYHTWQKEGKSLPKFLGGETETEV
ncbi:MAG: serine/threonine transporter SstT [Eubacterium sp.]|nr:serine/threonine transporter SstT [Eubacterium sp.]